MAKYKDSQLTYQSPKTEPVVHQTHISKKDISKERIAKFLQIIKRSKMNDTFFVSLLSEFNNF